MTLPAERTTPQAALQRGLGELALPLPAGASEKLLAELVRQFPNELTIICMGPATVIERAFDLHPDLPTQIKKIVLLGGSLHAPGNAGPVSEFHFACDPPAAQRVLHCKSSVTLIPLDMVFIGQDGTVKTIHVNARPMDTTTIPSQVPVRFVLEIAGGRSTEIGLKVGDKFEQPRVNSPMDR